MKRMLMILPLLWLAGCDRVNQENYNKLEMGMKYNDVVTLLGEPAQCDALLMAKSCVWGTESRQIDIKFADNIAILFSSTGL